MIHSISLHYDHLLYSATFPARLFLIFFCFVFCLPIHRAASFAVYDRPFRAFLHRQAGHSNSIWLACFHGVTRNRRRETADTCIPSTASTVAMTKIKKTIMSRIRRFCICEMGYKFFFLRSFVRLVDRNCESIDQKAKTKAKIQYRSILRNRWVRLPHNFGEREHGNVPGLLPSRICIFVDFLSRRVACLHRFSVFDKEPDHSWKVT